MSERNPSPERLTLAEASAEPVSAQHPVSPVGSSHGQVLSVRLSQVFLPCAEPAAVGTMLTVRLQLSEEAEVEMRARVVSPPPDRPAGLMMGMHLLLLGPSGDAATERVVASLNEADSVPPPVGNRGAQQVLVIDGNASHREAAVAAMRDGGFEVLSAGSGIEGLTLALKHQPAAIITDVNMPGMDGWQLLRVVRARPLLRRTAVIFLTELSSEAERLRGYQLGVDDYVAKPFSRLEFMVRVERIIAGSRAGDSGAPAGGMRGELDHVSLPSLLLLIEMERRTGLLLLARGDERARLYLRNGAVVRVDLLGGAGPLEGAARLHYLLDWAFGQFDLELRDVAMQDELCLTTAQILIEHARLQDEASR